MLEARAFVGAASKIPEAELAPATILKMTHRAAPDDAVELAKVWVEVMVSEGRLAAARDVVEDFLLPTGWQDLNQELAQDAADSSRPNLASAMRTKGRDGAPAKLENRSWVGHVNPFEAAEMYRSLLSPADAAAATSFMNQNADLVRYRTQMARKLAAERERNKEAGLKMVPGQGGNAAGQSFAALLAEHMGMTAELLIRDTLQATSAVRAHVRKRGRAEFEDAQRKQCGRAFYARGGGVVKWTTTVRYIEDCVLRWPHLDLWLERDDASELLVKAFPGYHAISRAETHVFAALGAPRVLALLLNRTGPTGAAIEDAMRQTPLHSAAANGHKETLAVLMAQGVSPTLPDVGKVQPLFHICRQPHLKRLLLEGKLAMPSNAPAPDAACTERDLKNMLDAVEREPRREDRTDDNDDSGAGWVRTARRKEGVEQQCDRRIELRSIGSVNENDFAARYASGSEPLVMRSHFPIMQAHFTRRALLQQEKDKAARVAKKRLAKQQSNAKKQSPSDDDDEEAAAAAAADLGNDGDAQIEPPVVPETRVRVEAVPDAEKYGAGLATNMTITEFILSMDRRRAEVAEIERNGAAAAKGASQCAGAGAGEAAAPASCGAAATDDRQPQPQARRVPPPRFAVVDVTEDHPWGAKIWGKLTATRAALALKARFGAELKNFDSSSRSGGDAAQRKRKEDAAKAKARQKQQVAALNRRVTPEVALGEFFRPPYSPRNRTAPQSIRQSYFMPVATAWVQFAETGATSNFVTSFVGRLHAVVHGEQRVVLLPPAFAVTTRHPVSADDFAAKTQRAADISDFQDEWHDRVVQSCVLLPGDVIFVPQYWAYAFESYNGESVSVTGRITWR